MSIRLAPSTESISFKRYQTSFYYETMNFIKEDLIDFTDKNFFKHMLEKNQLKQEDFNNKTSEGIKALINLRTDILKSPTKTNNYNLEKHIFTEQILKQLFKYSIFNLLKTQKNTLFILPCFDQESDNGASRFNKYITYNEIDKDLYEDIFKNTKYTINKIPSKDEIAKQIKNMEAPGSEKIKATDDLKKATEALLKAVNNAKSSTSEEDKKTKEAAIKEAAIKEKEEFEKLEKINDVLYKDTNQIIFIKPFSTDTNENIDSYKDRIKENINAIKETIKNRGNNVDNQAFTQIICFVNNDNTMFTNYFKTELKKKYADELNKQFNEFYSLNRIDGSSQTFNKSSTLKSELSEISVSSINNKIKNLGDITKSLYDYNYKTITDNLQNNEFKQNEQILLDKLNNFYKIRLDVSAMKSLSSTDNSSLFNIYMRFDNLDKAVVTNEIRPNKDTLYIIYNSKELPRVGHFTLNNESKNHYTFTTDQIEYAQYKDGEEFIKIKEEMDKKTASLNEAKKAQLKAEKEAINDEDDEELKANMEEVTNTTNNKPTSKISRKNKLFEIRYNYGQIQYKDITRNLFQQWSNDNYVKYYKEKSIYENYKWFSHKMIDNKYKENINIKYYKNTIYDIPSLKEYLISEKKYTDKTRLAVEFLDINLNDQELIKYNNFVFEKFKSNINNPNSNLDENSPQNILFEDRIKQGICSIIFEQNTLVLVKTTIVQTEKEKEKATADNFKMIKYTYTPINSIDKTGKIVDINKYFIENTEEQQFLRCDNKTCSKTEVEKKENPDPPFKLPSDLESQLSNAKKAFALTVVKITKDVLTDPVKLYLASECKTRKRKIKEGYYKVMQMFAGGSMKRKYKTNHKSKHTRRNKLIRKSKPKRHVKFRRTYSLKYPKV
jgi:hypothetical protein